jgi:hypothetical protein
MRRIDYPALKALVPMRDVLMLIGWEPTFHRGGGQYRGRCPIHESEDPRSAVFAVKGDGFCCFKCGERGDQLRLYALVRCLPIHAACVELCRELRKAVPQLPRQHARREGNRSDGTVGGCGGPPPHR